MKRSLDGLLAKGKRGLKFGKSLPIYLTLGLATAFTPINAQGITNQPQKQEQINKSYLLADANQEVLLDTTPPEIIFYDIINPIFSPNGDGVKDTSTIDLEFSEKVDYNIEIIDSSQKIAKSWSGTAQNPASKPWDGTCNCGYMVVPEGIYNIKVSLEDSVGNTFIDTSKTITLDMTTVNIAEEPTIPSEYSLSQNYPNPFNPRTTIKYSITAREHVSLSVYDIRGKKLETLVNQEQSPGEYKVIFDGKDISSGVYFVRMRAGEDIETRKMLLVK